MNRLSVAVVIPTIPGREEFLDRALASVHGQLRRADQVIVEYDGHRTGAAATRNRALGRVECDVVAWLDDDDLLGHAHICECVRVLEEHADTGLVYPCPVIHGCPDPTATTVDGVFPVSPWGVAWSPESEWHLRTRGSFIPVTYLVRTELARAAGGFPEGRTLADGRYQGEDERALLALLDAGCRFEHLPEHTWHWYAHGGNTAGKGL